MHRMPCFVSLVLIVAAAKIHLEDKALVAGTKQRSHADKAGRLRGQLGLSVFNTRYQRLRFQVNFYQLIYLEQSTFLIYLKVD
jgi:hypothetical protein